MSVLRLPPLPAASGKQHWGNLPGAALSLAIAEAASNAKRFTLLLTADSQSAERLQEELAFFAPQLAVLHFPDWETLPYDSFSPHQDIVSQRIAALYQLPELSHGVLVVPITTALHRLAPKRFLLGSSLVLDVGQKLDVEQMRLRLEAAGYRCVDTVYENGEFAVRGALIDLFPMGSPLPYRIDLFDDEIETLRTFDPENQRSIDKVESIRLLPAREFPLKKEAVTGFRARFRERFDVDFRRCPIYQDLSTGITPAGIEYYLPLFYEETATLFDYLPEDSQVFSLPGIEQAAEQFWSDVRNRYEERRVDPERPLLPPAELFMPVEDCFARLKLWPRVVASQQDVEPGIGRERFTAQALPELAIEAKASEPLGKLRRFLDEYAGRVLFTAESAGRREVLLELLARLKLRPQEVEGWEEFLARRSARRRPATGRRRTGCGKPAVRSARHAAPATREESRRWRERHQEPHRAARRLAGGAHRSRCRSLPGPGYPGDRRPGAGIPAAAVRRGRQALRTGRQPAPDRPLYRQRRRARATAPARLGNLAESQA